MHRPLNINFLWFSWWVETIEVKVNLGEDHEDRGPCDPRSWPAANHTATTGRWLRPCGRLRSPQARRRWVTARIKRKGSGQRREVRFKNSRALATTCALIQKLGCAFSLVPFWLPSRLPGRVDPAQGVGAAGVQDVLMQEEVRRGRVAVHVEEAEVRVLQLLQQAEPVAHHGWIIASHLKARPVKVNLQQQLTHRVQDSFQDQVLQNLPFCALHICLQHIHLEQRGRGRTHWLWVFPVPGNKWAIHETGMTINSVGLLKAEADKKE